MISEAEVTDLQGMLDERLESPDMEGDQWRPYYNVRNRSDRAITQMRTDEAMPSVRFKPEGRDADELKQELGYKKRFTKLTFAGTIVISFEAKKFDTIGKYARTVDELPDSFKLNSNIIAAAAFDVGATANASLTTLRVNGFPILDVETPDGLPVWSQAHTFRSNGALTQSNYLPSGTANQTSIEAGIQLIRGWKNSVGAPIAMRGVKIVTPGALFEDLSRVVRSELQSDTNSNAINTLYGMKLEQWNWLRSTASFYIMTNGNNKPRRDYGWLMAKQPEDTRGRAGVTELTWSENFAQGFPDWRFAVRVGST